VDRETGRRILCSSGWLSGRPPELQTALLAPSRWQRLEAGAPITTGGEEAGDMVGLASGIVAVTSVFGSPDTPVMHLCHAVFWMGYGPVLSGVPRRVTATARTPVWIARIAQGHVLGLLAGTPQWWRHFMPLALEYGDVAVGIAADLLIRGSERRCVAVLLRLSGCRFRDPEDAGALEVPIGQEGLSAAANLSRNTAGTILRRLEEKGLIHCGYGTIALNNIQALRVIADGA